METKIKNLLRSASTKVRTGSRLSPLHLIVCPFCQEGHAIPVDFDSIHQCNCGACFKVCGNETLETGVGDIANTLWSTAESSGSASSM